MSVGAGTLAVVVPAWNDAAELPSTLGALALAAKRFTRARVVVVAGGEDGSFPVAQRALTEHGVLHGTVLTQRPEGKMAALGDAMGVLGTEDPPDWLLILDADTHLLPDALLRAADFLALREDLIGAGPRLRLQGAGVGAAHDLVARAMAASRRRVPSVSGGALFIRARPLWDHLSWVFGPADYPLHIDYQICERAGRLTSLAWGYAPGFEVETPRARGRAFLHAERRHHRAMVARGRWRASRYVVGACLNTALPIMPAMVLGTVPVPVLWPVGGALTAWTVRRLLRWRREHATAARIDDQVQRVSAWAYARDEWLFSVTALLGTLDYLRERAPAPTFRGVRR